MTRAVDTIAPKRPLPPGRTCSSPWYKTELWAMKQVGRRLERRWRKSWDESDRIHLRAHYRAYAVAVRASKKKFFSVSIASSKCCPAELFRVVQGLVRLGPKEDPVPPSKARCDDFARHFREKIAQTRHELDTTNESEVSGETPMLPSDPELLDEFQLLRPDDEDKVLGRVLERVVAGQLQALLDETDYLDPFQSGFRPGYGTESALVALYNDLCREKDRGSASLLVLLDLSAAFDTIDHGILLDRLAGLGVGGTALQWFRSYLNGRFQKVVLGDYGSAPWQLCHGVPQGSILSPLLFNIYMKPLGEVIRRCGLRNHQYADDTQLYLSFSTNPGEAVAVLNRCLAEVMGWMRANKLKLNPDKTEVLDKVRSLGVLLNPELSLEAQVTTVARSAFLQLRLINQLLPYLEYDCLATVTHVLVTSRLDFCNALYVGLPLKTVRILQLVQNRAARLLTGMGHYVHMTPVLHQLHWLPIEVRAQFKVLVMTYKALNGLGPGYLKERLHPYMPDRPLKSAEEALLREPSMKEIRRMEASQKLQPGTETPSLLRSYRWQTVPQSGEMEPDPNLDHHGSETSKRRGKLQKWKRVQSQPESDLPVPSHEQPPPVPPQDNRVATKRSVFQRAFTTPAKMSKAQEGSGKMSLRKYLRSMSNRKNQEGPARSEKEVKETSKDDTKMEVVATSEKQVLWIQKDLDRLWKWAEDSRMMFNVEKCKVFHLEHRNGCHKDKLGDKWLESSTCERDLGVLGPQADDSAVQLSRLAPGVSSDAPLWDVADVSLLDRQLVALGRDEEDLLQNRKRTSSSVSGTSSICLSGKEMGP
ncbi:putative RNA-directed DNA polymerase from transposon BS [Varanus komodoensis]|nr:putative RNA-directed DNA polymerase from transposon BS [Varanus komodoensis]